MDDDTNRKELINSLPWTEKYRPKKINYVSLDKHIKNQIKHMIEKRDIPNVIFEGSTGVGKTSTIKCIAKELYKKYHKRMVLEMNASDDRGIKIQELIENFRRVYVHINDEDKDDIAKFKLIILDEADNMTDKAKHIISGFLKNSINDIRFVFTCNTKVNILPIIQSSCYIIKFPPLDDEMVKKRLTSICEMENIITQNTPYATFKEINMGLQSICEIVNGDMRYAINILQLTYNRYNKITYANVYNIQDKPQPEKSKEILMLCYKKNLSGALQKTVNMRNIGYSGTDIALGFSSALRLSICDDIPEETKIIFLTKISYSLYNISKGLDASLLQIVACISDLCT